MRRSEMVDKKNEVGLVLGKYVVVRTLSAGVLCGVLASRDGKECVLKEARLIHSWEGAKTCLDIATTGVSSANISGTATKVLLTEVITIIEATEVAERVLRGLAV